MKGSIRWTTADGVYLADVSTEMFVPWDHGFRFAFVAMPEGCPDVLCLVGLDGQVVLVVANGRMSRKPQTLIGVLDVNFVGSKLMLSMNLPDGTAQVVRLTEPSGAKAYKPTPSWTEFALRKPGPAANEPDLCGWFSAWNPYFKGKPGQDLPAPDVAGSPRVCQYLWAGALGPAYLTASGFDVPAGYRAAALDWTDQQFKRPNLYYDDAGAIMRHAEWPEVWVDQKGWRKGLHGKIERLSASPWTLEDSEHLAIDRELTAAMAWGDPAAWLLLDSWGETLLSRPLCHGPKIAQNQREIGYTIRTMALLSMAFGTERPQFVAGLHQAVANLTAAFGIASGRPYPSLAPPHTGAWSHGYPNKQDTENWFALMGWPWPPELDVINDGNDAIPWLQAKGLADGKGKHAYTVGDGGLFTYLRAVVVWETSVILNGLSVAIAIVGPSPELLSAAKHVAACVLGPGRENGIGQDEALFSTPTFHDSYAGLWPWRKTACSGPWNGTATWNACALAMATPLLPTNLAAEAKLMVKLMRDGSSFAKLPAVTAIETFWPTLN